MLKKELMLQPPWDEQLTVASGQEGYVLHYTYGQDCDEATAAPLTDKARPPNPCQAHLVLLPAEAVNGGRRLQLENVFLPSTARTCDEATAAPLTDKSRQKTLQLLPSCRSCC